MSTPLPPPYIPGQVVGAGNAVPFDVAGATAALDRAAASLKPGEHGALTVQLTQSTGLGAGLVLRGPWNTEALGTLTRSMAGQWGWSVGGRVSFAAALAIGSPEIVALRLLPPPSDRQVLGLLEHAPPAHLAPTWWQWFELFRGQDNGAFSAAAKALQALSGQEVRIRG
jgi:hypothetical protein